MKLPDLSQLPPDPRGGVFKIALAIWKAVVPKALREWLRTIVFQASPHVPVSVSSAFTRGDRLRLFFIGFFGTIVVCFVGTVYTTHIDGTLIGTDRNVLYFWRDSVDILNYVLICPLYVGIDLLLIATVVRDVPNSLAFVNRIAAGKDDLPGESYGKWFTLAVFVAVAGSVASIVKFVDDTRNPMLFLKNPWWCVPGAMVNGRRVLNLSGIYYSLINFSLSVASFLAILALFGAIGAALAIGKAIEASTLGDDLTFEQLQAGAGSVTTAYYLAKMAAFAYMLNALNWHRLQEVKTVNLVALFAFLAAMGIWFVSFPRYFIELRWFEFRVKRAAATSRTSAGEYQDIRPKGIRYLAHFLDSLLIGGFLYAAAPIVIGK